MKEKEQYDIRKHEFRSLMNQKGYRGQFLLRMAAGASVLKASDLSRCLDHFLNEYSENGNARPFFRLETWASYKSHDDNILCAFDMALSAGGFQIKRMEVIDAASGERKGYRPENNQRIPGRIAVQGLFPKPPIWKRYLRGRFRF